MKSLKISKDSPHVVPSSPLPSMLVAQQLQGHHTLQRSSTVTPVFTPLVQSTPSVPPPSPSHAPGALSSDGGDSSDNLDSKGDNPDLMNEQIPQDPVAQLAYTIQHLACSTHYFSFISIPQTKVHEPNQFDSADSHKLWTFLVQCELNFSDHPRAFQMDPTKVTFTQFYLKGITLKWFEPDLNSATETTQESKSMPQIIH